MAQSAYSVDFSPIAAVGQQMTAQSNEMRQAAYQDKRLKMAEELQGEQVAGMRQNRVAQAALNPEILSQTRAATEAAQLKLKEAKVEQEALDRPIPLDDLKKQFGAFPGFVEHSEKQMEGMGLIKEVNGIKTTNMRGVQQYQKLLNVNTEFGIQAVKAMQTDVELQYQQKSFELAQMKEKGKASPQEIAEAEKAVKDIADKRSNLLDGGKKLQNKFALESLPKADKDRIAADKSLSAMYQMAIQQPTDENVKSFMDTLKTEASKTARVPTIKTVNRGNEVDIYEDGVFKKTEKVEAKPTADSAKKAKLTNHTALNPATNKEEILMDDGSFSGKTPMSKTGYNARPLDIARVSQMVLKAGDSPDESQVTAINAAANAIGYKYEKVAGKKSEHWFTKDEKDVWHLVPMEGEEKPGKQTPSGPPAGFKDTGKTSGGKKVYSDGKSAWIAP